MSVDQDIANLVKEASDLTNMVENFFDNKNNEINEAVNDVTLAIPHAVSNEMQQNLYLDVVNGDDSNSGAATSPFKTFKALVDSVPTGAVVTIYGDSGQVININDDIHIANKKVVCRIDNLVINAAARIMLYGSLLKFSYVVQTINLTTSEFIVHFSADIRLEIGMLNPTGEAVSLFKQNYFGGDVSLPGSHHSNILVHASVSDAASVFYLFSPNYYKSSMIVTTFSLVLGVNVALFDPVYESIKIGNKGVYFVGA